MKMIKRYAGILMMLTLLVGFTSCESEEETEFNLPGEWYTNEEIDFGAYKGEETMRVKVWSV